MKTCNFLSKKIVSVISLKSYCISIVFFMLSISSIAWVTKDDILRLALYKFCIIVLPLLFFIFKMYEISLSRLIISVLILFMYVLLYLQYSTPVALNVGGLILVIAFINLKFECYFILFKNSVSLFSVMFLAGVILYVLYVLGFVHATDTINSIHPLKIEKGISFKSVYGALIITSMNNSDMYRFQSIFDEPGVVGSISGLILLTMNKSDSKWKKITMIISGLLSLSTAFFVFFILRCFIVLNFRRAAFSLISVCFLMLIVINSLPDGLMSSFQPIIDYKLSSGNNRVSSCFSMAYESNMPGNYLFGIGHGATQKTGCDISSFVASIYDYGYLGLAVIFCMVFFSYLSVFLSTRRLAGNFVKNKIAINSFLLWLFILGLNFYQRPDYFYLLFVTLLIGFLFRNNKGIHNG